jgi:hypothetical protein
MDGGGSPFAAADGRLSSNVACSEPRFSGSFAQDSVTWAFAKLAEAALGSVFREPELLSRYAAWQSCPSGGSRDPEETLPLMDVDLGCDGEISLSARPTPGEFILHATHERFHLLLAGYYPVFDKSPELEAVCVAHFEGGALLAARWAHAVRKWLLRHPERHVVSSRITHLA